MFSCYEFPDNQTVDNITDSSGSVTGVFDLYDGCCCQNTTSNQGICCVVSLTNEDGKANLLKYDSLFQN